jgi:5'/3'-nucleotidase SurE
MRSFCLLLVVPFAAAAAVLKESKNTDNSTSHTPNKAPIKLVLSNDDGWAEINIREFFHSLNDAGFYTILSAPATDQSLAQSFDKEPLKVDQDGCQFHSCQANDPPVGNNATDVRLNVSKQHRHTGPCTFRLTGSQYVNSFPVSAMKYALQDLSPSLYHGPPDLAVLGPNVGSTLAKDVHRSAIVAAAIEAAKSNLPAIAFSGATGSQTPWTATPENYTKIYVELATQLVRAVVEGNGGKKPYLPHGVW